MYTLFMWTDEEKNKIIHSNNNKMTINFLFIRLVRPPTGCRESIQEFSGEDGCLSFTCCAYSRPACKWNDLFSSSFRFPKRVFKI